VTSEGEKLTEDWVTEHGVTYAYGYDKKGKLSRDLGVKGIPHAFLINPSGKIVWEGHPGALEEEMITPHLKNAVPNPLWEWSKESKSVKTAIKKKQYGKALKAAEKLAAKDAQFKPILRAAKAMVEGQLNILNSSMQAGDYLAAYEAAALAKKSLAGHPGADEAKEIQAQLKRDKDYKKIMAEQKKLAKIRDGRIRNDKDMQKAILRLQKLATANKGNIVEKQAMAYMAVLRDK
jgi:hypothetical protein